MTRHRLAGAVSGLLLAGIVATVPVLGATAPSSGAARVAAGLFSVRCADEWVAARAAPSLATFRVVGDCEVARRLDTISKLRAAVTATTELTSGHRGDLTGILDASAAGLTALRTKIDGDQALPVIRTDVHAIFADYRVYALVARQVALVRGDDAVARTAAHLADGATKLQAAIVKAQANGRDVTVASAQLATMQAAIAAALAQVDGDAAAVLSQTPAGVNAGTAGPVLDAARASIHAARGQLAAALAAGKAAIAALK